MSYHKKDATLLTASKYLSDLFEGTLKIYGTPKAIANWILSDISRIINEKKLKQMKYHLQQKELAKSYRTNR